MPLIWQLVFNNYSIKVQLRKIFVFNTQSDLALLSFIMMKSSMLLLVEFPTNIK